MRYEMTYKNSKLVIDTDSGTISGNTYNAKEWIKENFVGIRWNAEGKNWMMDAEAMTERINTRKEYFIRIANLTESKEKNSTSFAHNHSGICPICHTYCDGDCQAAK